MSDRQFGRMTSREFWALVKRRDIETQSADYRTGLMAAAIYNVNRGEDTPFLHPHDLFATLPIPKKQRMRKMRAKDMFFLLTGKQVSQIGNELTAPESQG